MNSDPFDEEEEQQSSNYTNSQPESSALSLISSKPSSLKSLKYIDDKENKSDFKLEAPEKSQIYIFKNGLFSRTLKPVDPSKKRQMEISCTLCNYKATVDVKTFRASNQGRHYESKHPDIAFNKESEKTKKKRSEIQSNNSFFDLTNRKRPRTQTMPSDFDNDEFNNKLLNVIIDNNLPFSLLSSNSFKDLLTYLKPNIPVFNRRMIKTVLDSTFSNSLSLFNDSLNTNIKNMGKFSLITDIWTSNNNTAYLGIIVCYIDPDFNLIYKLIGFDPINEKHTGFNIFNEFEKSLSSYPALMDVANITSITRDNARNNSTFIEAFKNRYENDTGYEFDCDIHCIAHIINIVVNGILKEYILNNDEAEDLQRYVNIILPSLPNDEPLEIPEGSTFNSLINRVRRIAVLTKYTGEINKLLIEGIRRSKADGNLPEKYNKTKIPNDSYIRWNSTYNMINTVLELKEPLIYIYRNTEHADFQQIFFSKADWFLLTQLQRILKIFVKPSIKLQGEFYTTLSTSLLYVYTFYPKLKVIYDEYKEMMREKPELKPLLESLNQAIGAGARKLDYYFPKKVTANNIENFGPYLLAVILDPRIKLTHFQRSYKLHFYEGVLDHITTLFKETYEVIKNEREGGIETQSADEDQIQDNSDEESFFLNRSTVVLNNECETYLNEPLALYNDDPLLYWKNNQFKYPVLAILARQFLGIPASSAALERVFSTSSYIISKARNNLTPETVKQLTLLKSWGLKSAKEIQEFLQGGDLPEEEEDN